MLVLGLTDLERTFGGVTRLAFARRASLSTVRQYIIRVSSPSSDKWSLSSSLAFIYSITQLNLHAPAGSLCILLGTAISPFRQRAAKNMFSGYLLNGYRRLSSQFVYWAIPVGLGTLFRFIDLSSRSALLYTVLDYDGCLL
jgi:hypothetical protein